MRQIVPMATDAALGAGGALALDWLWGQVNPRLPDNLQSKPGQIGLGEAVKVVATVAVGVMGNRVTRGFAMRAAKGSLTVQAYNIIKSMLPANITQQLAYAQPAPVTGGQYWTTPDRVYRGAGVLPNSMGALLQRGGKTPLLSGVGALMRPGAGIPLLSGTISNPDARGLSQEFGRLAARSRGGIPIRGF